jgi:hypothetical protein
MSQDTKQPEPKAAPELESWRNLTPNTWVEVVSTALSRADGTAHKRGLFLGYSSNGYAKVRFKERWGDMPNGDTWYVHPETLKAVENGEPKL